MCRRFTYSLQSIKQHRSNIFSGTFTRKRTNSNAGVYSIPSPSTLNLDITLDAQGDPLSRIYFSDTRFIFD